MNLEGANIFNESNDYKIFTMNSANAGQYCVVLPKNSDSNMNMLVDLHMKDVIDGLSNGSKTKEEVIELINKEYSDVKGKFANGILVLPMLDDNALNNSIINSDKQKMFDEVKKIGAITSEVYKKLTDSGVDKNKISQQIVIVEKGENDNKFVSWLKEQMPNFVDGFSYEATKANTSNDIFGNNTVNEEVKTPEVNSESVVESTPEPVVSNDLFGGNNATTEDVSTPASATSDTTAPVENTPEPVISNDLFGNNNATTEDVSTPANATSDTVAPVENIPEPVASNDLSSTPVQETPSSNVGIAESATPVESSNNEINPIQSKPLDGTTTFSPVVDTNNEASAPAADGEVVQNRGASKGFANLLILLVILVGVTFVSIELGKYLYSVYGA